MPWATSAGRPSYGGGMSRRRTGIWHAQYRHADQSQAWLAKILSHSGPSPRAGATGRRRFVWLRWRSRDIPIVAHGASAELHLAKGDMEHAVRALQQCLALSVPPATAPSYARSGSGLCLYAPGAPHGRAHAIRGNGQRKYPLGARESGPLGSHGSARPVGCREATRRPGSTPARPSTRPGSRSKRARGVGAAPAGHGPCPRRSPDVAQAEANYQQALVLATSSACAPSWPTATTDEDLVRWTGRAAGPRRALDRYRNVPRHGDDLLAPPGRGSTGAGGGAMTIEEGNPVSDVCS